MSHRKSDLGIPCPRKIVRVRRFHMDIIKSIGGARGYLKHLESDAAARENFAAFMKGYYPP